MKKKINNRSVQYVIQCKVFIIVLKWITEKDTPKSYQCLSLGEQTTDEVFAFFTCQYFLQ